MIQVLLGVHKSLTLIPKLNTYVHTHDGKPVQKDFRLRWLIAELGLGVRWNA